MATQQWNAEDFKTSWHKKQAQPTASVLRKRKDFVITAKCRRILLIRVQSKRTYYWYAYFTAPAFSPHYARTGVDPMTNCICPTVSVDKMRKNANAHPSLRPCRTNGDFGDTQHRGYATSDFTFDRRTESWGFPW